MAVNTFEPRWREAARKRVGAIWGSPITQSGGLCRGLSVDNSAEIDTIIAIDALNASGEELPSFKGTEVRILPDGTLDYPDKCWRCSTMW